MLFNSVSYLIFFPVVFAVYWLAPNAVRRPILLIASYYFYMSWLRIYGLLLFALTAVNYLLGLMLDRFRERGKIVLAAGLLINLGTLCFFKYTNFILCSCASALNWLSPWLGKAPEMPAANILLPLGISFFAFEFIHYITDIYRGDKPIRNPVDFGLFAAFFPSQIAGPIKRYQDFMHQLEVPARLSPGSFHNGMTLIVQGLFKKIALSDNLAPLVAAGFQNATSVGAVDAWIATTAFALQIYFDFSGYTDMGRGSAILLGFSLPDNFNLPYIACNLSDFWKRWHISLSTWLRDYLYIPLGGGRVGRVRKHLNLMITMLLGGLWHGAAWHYVAWGGYHGLGLVVCHEYDSYAGRSPALAKFHKTAAGKAISAALTFLAVLVGWILFRAESVEGALAILQRHFSVEPSGLVVKALWQSPLPVALSAYICYALIQSVGTRAQAPWLVKARESGWLGAPAQAAIYAGGLIAAIGFCPAKAEPFIYFQF
jgi:alginate O-acetyltransferase complex protein AlgI